MEEHIDPTQGSHKQTHAVCIYFPPWPPESCIGVFISIEGCDLASSLTLSGYLQLDRKHLEDRDVQKASVKMKHFYLSQLGSAVEKVWKVCRCMLFRNFHEDFLRRISASTDPSSLLTVTLCQYPGYLCSAPGKAFQK